MARRNRPVYQAGENKIQYRCLDCGVVSPHENPCFRCGGVNKRGEKIPEIVPRRAKGQGLNIGIN